MNDEIFGKVVFSILLVLFILLLGVCSFSVTYENKTIEFSGWFGKLFEWIADHG